MKLMFLLALLLNTVLLCEFKLTRFENAKYQNINDLRESSNKVNTRQNQDPDQNGSGFLTWKSWTLFPNHTWQKMNNKNTVSDSSNKVLGAININEQETKDDKPNNRLLKKRSVIYSPFHDPDLIWTHSEKLDDKGDFILRWISSESSITFRAEARTQGYLGVGFSSKGVMTNADLLVAWVDDRNGNAKILDCHGPSSGNGSPIADEVQNYELISGFQNNTHTTVEFRRDLDTCDGDDFIIGQDTTQVLWALGPPGSDGQLAQHDRRGARPLRLLMPAPTPRTDNLHHWDVRLRNITIPDNMATFFWCKLFKTPELPTKHHIVGYQPIINSVMLPSRKPIESNTEQSPVHHIVLYECAESPDLDKEVWNEWTKGDGYYGPLIPREWAACLTPIAAWAMGSKGEFFPSDVGIPLAESGGVSYYKLEIHYDTHGQRKVLDNSGLRLHFTHALRRHDAALLVTGVTISALHVVPPRQPAYTTAGYCTAECTDKMLPEEGINIVSVLLHAHGTGKRMALRHIRNGEELPPIAEDGHYDARYQQSRAVVAGRRVLRGDGLVTECRYDTRHRTKPTLGGYSDHQEMCLAFVLYYPRTALAGCYSMTPVQEFFQTFGVREFYGRKMTEVENLFLASGSLEYPELLEIGTFSADTVDEMIQGDDQGVNLLSQLVIREPPEFRNKSFIEHLNEIPWGEPLLTKRIEDTLYKGAHMTFCRKRDETLAVPIEIQNFPNFTELASNPAASEKSCRYKGEPRSANTAAARYCDRDTTAAVFATVIATAVLLLSATTTGALTINTDLK